MLVPRALGLALTQTSAGTGSKSWIAALLLCFFVGLLGVHRFYVGKIGTGILMLITFGGFGLWTLVIPGRPVRATNAFGLDRTARNSRYASSNATPNRTTRPPAASRDRTNRKPLHADIQAPLTTRSTSTNMPWINHLHIKQKRTFVGMATNRSGHSVGSHDRAMRRLATRPS
jgi:TM2 domain-containing membrane protein YozV